jgi:5-methyltetrahydrofolate--homocysteine methyltransferase
MSDFITALHSGRVLLMDGAMGTELMKAGLRPDENAAAWNVLHPERVRSIHRAYLAVGADVLLTNTFLVNSTSYSETMWGAGRAAGWIEPWQAAYELIGPNVYRVAAVGPVAGPPTAREFDMLGRLFVSRRCNEGQPHDCLHFPHAILLETCSSPRVRYAVRHLRRRSNHPILLSLTYLHNTRGELVTFSGHRPEWFARRAREYGLTALGVNCGRDVTITDCAEIVRRYGRCTDLPLFARPNAGTPVRAGELWVYPHTPEAMAEQLPALLEAGVCMVGGCCGTTPAHIAAFRTVVDAWNAARR